ncbi:hypothetical protein HRU87_05315 [Aquiluna borgnonia]|uniref:Cytochrome b5 heme-binding domain-containing protein n=2 Tax=Aquiluna borgnonia TaxID=2499157 RepID=A0A7D4TJE2_9MICO|nr:hypothetical protein HRU87_05315 [Aquiluna borgnonia]
MIGLLAGCASPTQPIEPVSATSSQVAEPTQSQTQEAEDADATGELAAEPEESEPSEAELEESEEAPSAAPKPSATVTDAKASAKPSPTASESKTPGQTPTATPSPSATAAAGFTMEQVKSNNSASSCWAVVDKNVYDLTNWISQHPGGSGAISSLCGTDATSQFYGQHGRSGSPSSVLKSFLLGPLG